MYLIALSVSQLSKDSGKILNNIVTWEKMFLLTTKISQVHCTRNSTILHVVYLKQVAHFFNTAKGSIMKCKTDYTHCEEWGQSEPWLSLNFAHHMFRTQCNYLWPITAGEDKRADKVVGGTHNDKPILSFTSRHLQSHEYSDCIDYQIAHCHVVYLYIHPSQVHVIYTGKKHVNNKKWNYQSTIFHLYVYVYR